MKGKLDIGKMDAAFKRAADKAVHGTREERSGRFDLRDNERMPDRSNFKRSTRETPRRRS
jgi:hypothetical protein